ncbi:MAG TPA: ATP-grasp domain-containing protein [Gryllotalpicola sp.]
MAPSHPNNGTPVLAIVLDSPMNEFFPLIYVEAAAGVCLPLWVTLRDDAETARYARILGRSGAVLDAHGLTAEQAAAAIGEHAPAGIVTFNEANVPWTAEVAELLELPYYSRRTAAQLADKLEQRAALRGHGLSTPGFWDVDALRHDAELLDEVAEAAAFPLVLKPRVGRASRDMARVDTAARLRELVAEPWPAPMMVEEFIPDPSQPVTGPGNGFYVSVEVLVSHGVVSALGVTGRHPLVEPFREAGLFFPAEVSPELHDAMVETAVAAIRALGIDDGALHVEIKATDAGPVVIEINPRPGGSTLPDLLRHALGIDIFQATMRLSIGERLSYDGLPRPGDVGFSVYVLPPDGARVVTSVDGVEGLKAIPGVDAVVAKLGAGDEVDPEQGMLQYVALVSGTVPDHDARRRAREQILSQVVVTGAS